MALAYEAGPNWSFSYYKHFHYPFVVRDSLEFITLCKIGWWALEHFKDTQSHQLLHNLVKFVIGKNGFIGAMWSFNKFHGFVQGSKMERILIAQSAPP
jgi:hypothetical protein